MKPSMYNNLQQMDDDEDDNIFNPTGSCYSPSGVPIQTIVPSPSTPRTIIPMSALKSSNGSMPMVMFYNEGDEDLYKVQ